MKIKVFLFLMIVAPLFLSAQELETGLAQYQDSIYVNTVGSHGHNIWGTYYNGCAWIFYASHNDLYPKQNIFYYKVKIVPDGTRFGKMEFVKDDEGNEIYHFPKTDNPKTGPCAVVYKGMLYLFWTDSDQNIKFSRTDGETWSDSYDIGVTAQGKNLAAAVMNDKLYLLKQNTGSGIKLMSSENGKTWSNAEIIYYNSDDIETSSLGLTPFITSNGKSHLLIGINRWGGLIETRCWDKNNGLYNDATIPGAKANGISLVTGRVAVYSSDDRLLPVQCYMRGTDGKIWRAHFNPANKDQPWTTPKKLGEMPSSKSFRGVPSAFSNFNYMSEKHIEKQIWLAADRLVTSVPSDMEKIGLNMILSEDLIRKETVTSTCLNDTALWTLVGVVEGPPPFVLNGQELDPQQPPSTFTYGTTTSTEAVNSTDWTISTNMSLKVPLLDGLLTCGADLSAALSHGVSTTYSKTYNVAKSIVAGKYSLGYYFFETPTITRYKYVSYTPQPFHEATGEYQYLYAVTGSSLFAVDFPLERFNTSDITTYVGKDPDAGYPRIANKTFSWDRQSSEESTFYLDTSKSVTTSGTIGIGVSVGVDEIFDVSANYEITLSSSHTTHFGQSITISIHNPEPRDGVATDVKSYKGVAYWLKAPNANAWWIPEKFKDQRPWCVTWSVNDIVYNTSTGVANTNEKQFTLLQNQPNPFRETTAIRYVIEKPARVSLIVYNILGKKVATLVDAFQATGKYTVHFDAAGLPSGTYLYQIKAGDFEAHQFMNVVK
jgi:hypothetical protein